ncbi:hypothetical protein DS901_16250 [Loktanella sp. D2R18]|uniref:hypothetical protein n=1 Tax=Rhodobacterales TaxID=204455 RepID=UPI000DEBE807|nr:MULTISPECIES: hypothetical protein [Rhodobacterales]MDO6590984.1 hypothetical protein [Yoonia sp. 1_MG-2023]RBW42255.1 hypothetical protein DS901_16250 [Loktanella sp. D2R18]
MTGSNRKIAIGYLDAEVVGAAGLFLKRVKKALENDATAELKFNTFALVVDPSAQTVTLHQDWFACQPEVFNEPELIELIETARERIRNH